MIPNTYLALLLVLSCLSPLSGSEKKPPFGFGADSRRQDGLPRGWVTRQEWRSTILDGTLRQWYLYGPSRYEGKTPAAVMVFQDGHAYAGEEGDFRVPVVFDNLIHQGAMPATIGIFLNPGLCTAAWQRPDLFRKVVSHIGSVTNIRGGDVYPAVIRKGEKSHCAYSFRMVPTTWIMPAGTGG